MDNTRLRWNTINDICTVCRKMWQRGWVANHDGNASVKIDGEILAPPTAVSKADIIPEIILTLDLDGKKLAGPGRPFSEIQLHLAAYRSRADVFAVVHAHPPYATARGACGMALDEPFIPESVVSLGDRVPVAPFAMPGAPENEKIVADMLRVSNVFMLPGNGILAVGTDVMQAYLRLELAEHLAHMDFIAHHVGRPFELSDGDKAKLLEKHAAAFPVSPQTSSEKLVELITEEILAIMQR